MANWKDYANRVKNSADWLTAGIRQKNSRIARMNRLRTVIRCQEQAAEKEYLALGRYYYNALRDKDNQVAEEHCAKLDQIQAQLDSTLEALEQAAREQLDGSASIGIIGGKDGPTAIYIHDNAPTEVCIQEKSGKKEGTLFHFHGGPLEITVTRDTVYHPEDEDSEEIDLSDVESFDHDPMAETAPSPTESETPYPESEAVSEPELGTGAEIDENGSLPFEG